MRMRNCWRDSSAQLNLNSPNEPHLSRLRWLTAIGATVGMATQRIIGSGCSSEKPAESDHHQRSGRREIFVSLAVVALPVCC